MKSPKCWTSPLANKQETVPSSCWEILDVSGWEKHPSKKGEKKRETNTKRQRQSIYREHAPACPQAYSASQGKRGCAYPAMAMAMPSLLATRTSQSWWQRLLSYPMWLESSSTRSFSSSTTGQTPGCRHGSIKMIWLVLLFFFFFFFFFPTICLEIDRLWK